MDTGSEESEIKIEYHENFEIDPLCQNIKSNLIENNDIFTGSILSKNIQNYNIEIEDETTPNLAHIEKLEGNGSDVNISYDDYLKDSDDADEELRKEATWYKEIDNIGRYLCRFCELTYSTIQTLRHHIKTKHPAACAKLKGDILNNKRNRKLKCHICQTKFKLLEELKEHVKVKHEIENVETSCTNCDATFRSQNCMLEHLFNKHRIVKNQIFSCLTCGYRTLKRSHFKQHMNTHLKSKSIQCEYCDYSTNYSPNFRIHKRIHTNVKPYICTFNGCDYRSSAKSALRSHQLKHNREVNMQYCDKCSYKTVYKQSLKKHLDSHRRNSVKINLINATSKTSLH